MSKTPQIHGLMAQLNFNVPYIPKAQNGKHEGDVIVHYQPPSGKLRKVGRYSINLSGYMIQHDEVSNTRPKTLAVGNDRQKNLFIVFDPQDVEQTINISYGKNAANCYSMAVVKKIGLCCGIGTEFTGNAIGVILYFNAEVINDGEAVRLTLVKKIEEYVDPQGNISTKIKTY